MNWLPSEPRSPHYGSQEKQAILNLLLHCDHMILDFIQEHPPEQARDLAEYLEKFVAFQQEKLPEQLQHIRRDAASG